MTSVLITFQRKMKQKYEIMNETMKTKNLKRLQYPISKYGYAEVVNPADQKEILYRLDQFGVVVVPVLSPEEQSQLLDSFFKESNEQQRPGATHKLSIDPITWGSENWPSKSHFLVRRRPTVAFEPTITRTHPIVHQVFATIFGTDKLLTSIDRWGVMRGTVDIPTEFIDGSIIKRDYPEWRQNLRLHWDMNPWAYIEEKSGKRQQRYQALIAVLDSPVEVGGFRAVPGSHRYYLEQWADSHEMPDGYSMTSYQSVKISNDDPAQSFSQKIPVRAGDMVVFDSRLLHGTFENKSQAMRLVQYVRMMPHEMANGDVFSATNVLARHPDWKEVLRSYPLDNRSKRLLGLEDYSMAFVDSM